MVLKSSILTAKRLIVPDAPSEQRGTMVTDAPSEQRVTIKGEALACKGEALDLVRSTSMVSLRETIKGFALACLLLFLLRKNKRSTYPMLLKPSVLTSQAAHTAGAALIVTQRTFWVCNN